MTTNTTQKAADATKVNGLDTVTNEADFRTGDAMGQAPDGKAIATQIARLALAAAPARPRRAAFASLGPRRHVDRPIL